MKTHNLKLHVLASLLACGSVFHVGCGDDDDGATPSNTGGKSSTTGGATSTGGKTAGTGGKTSATGGSATTGGSDGTAGAGDTTSTGGGPEAGGAGGSAGTPGTGGAGGSGGEAGGGGAGNAGPECTSAHYDATNECYSECEPATSATSEQFLNRCSEAGKNCTKFDNSTLTKLGANGALPALP
jgi:hypothetical protein